MLMRNGQKRLKAQVVQRNEPMLEDATKVYDDEAK